MAHSFKKTALQVGLATVLFSGIQSSVSAGTSDNKTSSFSNAFQTYYAHKAPDAKGQYDYNLFGIYGYIGYKKHSLELGYDGQDSKTYKKGTPEDLTVIYSNYSIPNIKLKLGVRDSDINDKVNQSSIYILGVNYTKYNYWGYAVWNVGLDAYYNDSKHEAVVIGNTYNPNSVQLSLSTGRYFIDKYNPSNTFYAQLNVNVQNFDKNNNPYLDVKDAYTSGEGRLSYIMPKWTITGAVTLGESYNLIDKGGFVYNNDYHTYTSSGSVEVSYAITKKVYLKPWIKYQSLKKTVNDSVNEYLITTGAVLGFSL